MRSITMLMTLRGGYAKLREDLANSYAAGMDTYFRRPSEMRDYLVNWRNAASRAPRSTGNALAFAQDDDEPHHHEETHTTIGTRPRGRCWDCNSPDHYKGDKDCPGKPRGITNTTGNSGEVHATLGNAIGGLQLDDFNEVYQGFAFNMEATISKDSPTYATIETKGEVHMSGTIEDAKTHVTGANKKYF
jgi:hypothetical protein